MLLCDAVQIARLAFLQEPEQVLTPQQRERFLASVERRLAREPVTRIIGKRGFWDIELAVARDVLDPRGDTETLVEAALQIFDAKPDRPLRVADLGCGSGAIICALLHQWPTATGIAVDLSPQACALTQINAQSCGVAGQLSVLQRSWAGGLPGPFDLVISNPPYVPSADIAQLAPEVRLWDPALALDGGRDGLDAYRALSRIVPASLSVGGWLVLEVGFDQAASVTAILTEAGFGSVQTFADLGGHTRTLAAQYRQ